MRSRGNNRRRRRRLLRFTRRWFPSPHQVGLFTTGLRLSSGRALPRGLVALSFLYSGSLWKLGCICMYIHLSGPYFEVSSLSHVSAMNRSRRRFYLPQSLEESPLVTRPLHTRSPHPLESTGAETLYRASKSPIAVTVRSPCVTSSWLGFQGKMRRDGITESSAYRCPRWSRCNVTPVTERHSVTATREPGATSVGQQTLPRRW